EDEEDEQVEEDEYEPLEPIREVEADAIDPEEDTLFLRLQSSYAAAVTYLDAGVGEILSALNELPGADEVVVVVTSDCGLALGEHGVGGPSGAWPHEELIHVPLLVRLPGCGEAGRRVEALTQAVDLAPTLAEMFGVPVGSVHGASLLPMARGQAERVR